MINWYFNMTNEQMKNTIDDIAKGVTAILVIHFLSFAIDNDGSLLDTKTLKLTLYFTIAMIIYNLTIKGLINT